MEVDTNTNLLQDTRKISNKQCNLTLKSNRERKTKKNPKLVEGKNSKDQSRYKRYFFSEIKEKYKKSMKLKAGSFKN